MSTYYGTNAAKLIASPQPKIAPGEYNGHIKVMYDEHTFEANVYSISDVIKVGAPLPKNARVLEVKVFCDSLGTTGIMEVGYEANGVDNADTDGFIDAADAGGQAVHAVGDGPAIGKKFTAETQVIATMTEASDGASGDKARFMVFYIVD